MRVFNDGWELGTVTKRGWTVATGSATVKTERPHQDAAGAGGNAHLYINADEAGSLTIPILDMTEGWLRFAVRQDDPDYTWKVTLDDDGSVELLPIQVSLGPNNQVQLSAGFTGDVSTEVLADGTWHVITLHWLQLESGGVIEVFLGEDLDTAIGTISGVSTLRGEFTNLKLEGRGTSFDDLAVHTPSMSYTSGSGGAPVAGETLTGQESGATAIITAVDGDDETGRLYLRAITGVFAAGEPLATDGTFVASNDGGGLDDNSTAPSPLGYIALLRPTYLDLDATLPEDEVLPVDPRVVQDWAPLSFELSDGYTDPAPVIVNSAAFADLTWTEGDPGVWTVTWTNVASEKDGIQEMPQLQFLPEDLFASALEAGQIIQIAVEFGSATVPTGYGVGPCIGAGYGSSGAAGIGTLDGNGYAVSLEGGGAGNARGADVRETFDVIREEFDWPIDYEGSRVLFEICLRKDDESQDRTAFIRVGGYLADGTPFYSDGTAGSPDDISLGDLVLLYGLYSRYGTAPLGSYSMVMTNKYRLLEADAFPS